MKAEFLTLNWAITEKFREYLLGNKCLFYTDINHLSWQYLPDPRDIQSVVSETPVPKHSKPVVATEMSIQASHLVISVLPSYAPSDLCTVQAADPTIQEPMVFWRDQRHPTWDKRGNLLPQCLTLLSQWDHLIESDGLLYNMEYISVWWWGGILPVCSAHFFTVGSLDPTPPTTWPPRGQRDPGTSVSEMLLASHGLWCAGLVRRMF